VLETPILISRDLPVISIKKDRFGSTEQARSSSNDYFLFRFDEVIAYRKNLLGTEFSVSHKDFTLCLSRVSARKQRPETEVWRHCCPLHSHLGITPRYPAIRLRVNFAPKDQVIKNNQSLVKRTENLTSVAVKHPSLAMLQYSTL